MCRQWNEWGNESLSFLPNYMHCLKQEKIDSSFIVCRLDKDNYFVIKTISAYTTVVSDTFYRCLLIIWFKFKTSKFYDGSSL